MAKILHRGDTNDGFMRGEGKFEILQEDDNIRRQLFQIEKTGRICYRSERHSINWNTAEKFIRMIMKRGHESVIEHSSLTVIFSNVSRGFTHEMVRQRLCAFSQESTRYVDYDGGKLDTEKAELTMILPPHIPTPEPEFSPKTQRIANILENYYQSFRQDGWRPQDARQFLPIGIASKIAVTANFREWRHIMKMRTQKAAHWEIRYIMCDLLLWLKNVIPVIFEDFVFSDKPDSNGYMYTV